MGGRRRITCAFVVCLILAQFNISVMGSVESRLRILEILFDKVLKDDVDSLNARLGNLEKREEQNDDDVDRTVLKEELQEIVDDVNTKTKRMLSGFSAEKEKLQNLKKSIVNEVKGVEQQFVDINKQFDGLDKQVQGIDKHFNDSSKQLRLIDRRMEVIDKQVERTGNQVDNIDFQVATIDNQITGINENLTSIDEHVKSIDSQVKDNAAKIQDIDHGIAAMKTNIGNLKKDTKAVEKKNCPSGWNRQLSSCILYVRQEKDWIGARNYCKRKGANLVEPISRYALQVLTEELPSSRDRWWIGASDRRSEGRWIWESSGNTIGDVNWNSGEPNNEGGVEDCMELIYDSNFNDQNCNFDAYFMCEIKL